MSVEIEIVERLIRIEGKLDGNIERIDDIEHELYGNGQPGMARRLTIVETIVEERTDPKKVAGIASLLSSVITILAALLAREAGL